MTDDRERADALERALGKTVSRALPAAVLLATIGMALTLGPGPALLVLTAGTLLAVIALLWASLRTLSGEAPVSEGLEIAATRARETTAVERKRRVLRSLKDLEHEHNIGKIDDKDYAEISARYRDEAKAILREMDIEVEPLRAKAEELARKHLAKRGFGKGAKAVDAETSKKGVEDSNEAEAEPEVRRLECAKCSTSNDLDAAFCKKCGAALATAASDDKKESSDASA